MRLHFSPVIFAIVYCVAYVVVLSMDAPLFRYYPQTGEFTLGWTMLKGHGPAMAWYGLMANAAITGSIFALIVPEQKFAGALRNRLWCFPLFAMVACVYLMKQFFLR